MNLTVTSAPHIRSGNTTQRTMLDVLIALVPALIAGVVLFGLRALVLTVISAAGCVVAELLVNLVMRKSPRWATFPLLSPACCWPSPCLRAAPTGSSSWATPLR